MAYIYKVQNGAVHTLNQYGGQIRAPFHPAMGGNAIFVDYNSNLERLLVTTDRGAIIFYNNNGGTISHFTVKDVVMARWQGDDILVQLKSGKCILYNKYGGMIKHL